MIEKKWPLSFKLTALLLFSGAIAFALKLTVKDSSASLSKTNNSPVNGSILALLSEEKRTIPEGMMCFNANSVRVKSWEALEFNAAVKQLSPKVLRFPGGEVANYWDWRRGGLVTNLNNLPGDYPNFLRTKERQYTAGKLENFKVSLERNQAEPLFVLNMLTSSLESQIRMLKKAEAIGLPVQKVELGNEFYFATPNPKAVFPSPADYAQQASVWLTKLKQEFPNAEFSVVGVENQGLEGYKKFNPRRRSWNELVLPETLKTADAATFHLYPNNGLDASDRESTSSFPFFDNEDAAIILGEPFRYWDGVKSGSDFSVVPDDKSIWITEYNLHEKVKPSRARSPKVIGSWAHGLYVLAMSLLFLEDSRIDKICSHVLVGSSQFAAILADEKSFINPTDATRVMPNSLSATGNSLKMLGKALDGANSAQKIDFDTVPYISGKNQFQYPALYGWFFETGDGGRRALLMNVSNTAHEVNLTSIFQSGGKFEQFHSLPRTLVYADQQLSFAEGELSDNLLLQSFSVTLIGGNE